MPNSKHSTEKDAAVAGDFRIGTVSQLTGIDPHTIRAWERRYGAIQTKRTKGGSRRYDEGHVTRLQLIKAAVSAGDAVSVAAKLSNEELRSRLAELAGLARREGSVDLEDLELGERSLRLGVLGHEVAERLSISAEGLAQIEIVVSEDNEADLVRAVAARPVDVLLCSLDALGSDPAHVFVDLCQQCQPRIGIVTYAFARRSELAQLAAQGAKLLRGPIRAHELRRAIFDLLVIGSAPTAEAELGGPLEIPEDLASPARLFSEQQIARLSEISSAVECECPNHLSQLIASLVEFERYSHGCVHRSPADERLHRRLAAGTGQARQLVEKLLREVCEHDGLRL